MNIFWKIYIVISLIINIIFVLAIFFKSAINDIVRESWLEKRREKKDRKKYLIELKSNLSKLLGLSITLIIQIAQRAYGHPEHKNNLQKCMYNWGEINDLILKNEINYPKDINSLYKEYSKIISDSIIEALEDKINKEKAMEIAEELSKYIRLINERVDSHLGLR